MKTYVFSPNFQKLKKSYGDRVSCSPGDEQPVVGDVVEICHEITGETIALGDVLKVVGGCAILGNLREAV